MKELFQKLINEYKKSSILNKIIYLNIGVFLFISIFESFAFITQTNIQYYLEKFYLPADTNKIDFITIATTGNSHDFGDMTNLGTNSAAACSATRMVIGSRVDPAKPIDYLTIATKGDTINFGDMTVLRTHNAQATSSTRSVIAMGYNKTPSTGNYDNQATSEVFTFSTLGNATNFGDMINTGISPGGTSDSVRGVWAGGSSTNTIQYVNISTTGDSVDFGDLVTSGGWMGGVSNGHGGLG